MRHTIARQVVLEALRFFDRVEVGALDILDQVGFEDLLIVEVYDGDGYVLQSGLACRTQPALAGYQLIALADLTYHQRLQHAMRADAGAQRRQLVIVESFTRLIGIALDRLNRHLRLRPRRRHTTVT